ncbi:MAG: hypothetical protein CSA76_04615 [Spirochaetales bacterium]|nr:MAG: hypothetical protein CSA76_04615 [Spirochaetales bacterium]
MNSEFKISTLKGIYTKKEPVSFCLSGRKFIPGQTDIRLKISYLDECLEEICVEKVSAQVSVTLSTSQYPQKADGFGCSCTFYKNGRLCGQASTAFNFINTEKQLIRYGFLSDFAPEITNEEDSLNFLAEFHITHVQFYDWAYRPHQYEGPASVYTDTMGKVIDSECLKRKITGCQKRNMKTLGYGAVYAAGAEYQNMHPDLSLCDMEGTPYNLIDRFFIMDIQRDSPWLNCILTQYRFALERAGFDGIHMDTYGFPKRAFTQREGTLQLVYLEDDFPDLINEVRNVLGKKAVLIFNNVGNWPVAATGAAPQDGIYVEVWSPYHTYSHIRQIILGAAVFDKPVILAAYLAPFRLEKNKGSRRALNAALILHSVITSLGATHLLAGENGAVLTQGYYNDYSLLTDSEREHLKEYYDFQVRYLDIFYDTTLSEISETHTSGENQEYCFSGCKTSADGKAGTVWTIVRENKKRKVIVLINLTSQTDNEWNSGKNDTDPVNQLKIQIPADGRIFRAFKASPDIKQGEAQHVQARQIVNARE